MGSPQDAVEKETISFREISKASLGHDENERSESLRDTRCKRWRTLPHPRVRRAEPVSAFGATTPRSAGEFSARNFRVTSDFLHFF